MAFVDFTDLTKKQAIEAIGLRPKWLVTEFIRFAFWVTQEGNVSRRSGHHRLSAYGAAELDKMLDARRQPGRLPEDGNVRGTKFHTSR